MTDQAWLVVGLGNPGPRYEATRHNIGAWVVDRLAERLGARLRKVRFLPLEVAEASNQGARLYLARPQTFMNESGPPVASFARRRRLDTGSIVGCHDEIDLPFGALKLKRGGSTAGHNGLNSVVNALHSSDFYRVRLGVGRPRGRQDPADYVLDPFAKSEREEAAVLAEEAADAVLTLVSEGLSAAQDRHNRAAPKI
jgi:peptidyl-tRNA hydrolase, PTH1 family